MYRYTNTAIPTLPETGVGDISKGFCPTDLGYLSTTASEETFGYLGYSITSNMVFM